MKKLIHEECHLALQNILGSMNKNILKSDIAKSVMFFPSVVGLSVFTRHFLFSAAVLCLMMSYEFENAWWQ